MLPSLLLLTLTTCAREPRPGYCLPRADDTDCDAVPDAWDLCPETAYDARTDPAGCSEGQAAGCTVSLASPEDGAAATSFFRWTGTCDVYLLQFSDDPAFPAGDTRTAARVDGQAVSGTGTETYWRVSGGRNGSAAAYATPPRRIRW